VNTCGYALRAPDPLANVRECCRRIGCCGEGLGRGDSRCDRGRTRLGLRWDRYSASARARRSAWLNSTTLRAVGCGRGSGGPPGRRPVEARIDVIGRGLPALRRDRQVRGGHGSRRVRLRRQLLVHASSPQHLPLGLPLGDTAVRHRLTEGLAVSAAWPGCILPTHPYRARYGRIRPPEHRQPGRIVHFPPASIWAV